MKNYKNILFIAVSIIATSNNHITKAGNSTSSPQFEYTDYLNQLRHDLRGVPQKDIDATERIAQKKLNAEKPKNGDRVNQIMRESIVDRVRDITIDTARHHTTNPKEIEASVRSMVGNVKARLARGENLNGLAVEEFFDRNSLKQLILQNVKNPYHNSSPTYLPQPSTYSTKLASQTPAPKKPSRLHFYRDSDNEYLARLKNKLRGIPSFEINAIAAIVGQELIRKRPTNEFKKNEITRKVIINRVRMNTHALADRLTNNQTTIDNTIESMSGNVKARLAGDDNLNGQALKQFFGPSLKCMIKQNISNIQKMHASKYAPSAPEELDNKNECCICFENPGLIIPCPEGEKHSDQICSACISVMTNCPICRLVLKK